jgi:Fe-S-cluster-containing dehydrogenase component
MAAAPVVRTERCVGCGLCQTRCYAINVKEKSLLARSAIVVEAGEGKEDRLLRGSYRELREREAKERLRQGPSTPGGGAGSDSYLPEFLKKP